MISASFVLILILYYLLKQVQQLFPQFPRNLIVEDLRGTRSIEWTVANILDGVLMSPHHIIEEPQLESVLQIHTSTTETSVSLNTSSMPLPSDPRFDIPLADRYFLHFHNLFQTYFNLLRLRIFFVRRNSKSREFSVYMTRALQVA